MTKKKWMHYLFILCMGYLFVSSGYTLVDAMIVGNVALAGSEIVTITCVVLVLVMYANVRQTHALLGLKNERIKVLSEMYDVAARKHNNLYHNFIENESIIYLPRRKDDMCSVLKTLGEHDYTDGEGRSLKTYEEIDFDRSALVVCPARKQVAFITDKPLRKLAYRKYSTVYKYDKSFLNNILK